MRKSLSLCLSLLLAHCSVYDESLLPDGSTATGGTGGGSGGNLPGLGGTGGGSGGGDTGGTGGGGSGGGGNDTGDGGSGGSGNDTGDGGSGDGGSGGGGSGGSGGGPTYTYEYTLITSLEHSEDHIDLQGGGYWFTAWDEGMNAEACIEPNGTGQVKPEPLDDERTLSGMSPSSSFYAMHLVTTGCSGWGAQAGFGLQVDLDPDAEEGALAPFDASEYDGIAFWAKASTTERRVRVEIADVTTNPWGGECVEGGPQSTACHANYQQLRTVSTEWRLWRVAFADMRQPSHGLQGGLTPDTTQLYQVVFSFFYSNPIDILIDDVYFYKAIEE